MSLRTRNRISEVRPRPADDYSRNRLRHTGRLASRRRGLNMQVQRSPGFLALTCAGWREETGAVLRAYPVKTLQAMLRRAPVWVLILLTAASASPAHHGTAVYDTTKLTTLKGTVTDYQFINPHSIINL